MIPRRTPRTARPTQAPRSKHSTGALVAAWLVILPLLALVITVLVALLVALWRFIL